MVSDQLATGGAERCAASLSHFFEANNCIVHHVIVVDKVEYDFSGQLFNIGALNRVSNPFFNRMYRFWVLNQFFRNNKFEYIIDFRMKNNQFQEFIIAKLVYNAPLIVSIRSYNTKWYFPKNKFLAKKIYSHCHKIITVSEKIKQKIKSDYLYTNTETIYNSLNFNYIHQQANQEIAIDFPYILAIGRMDDGIKQFDKLMNCYASTNLKSKGIKLLIIGDGIQKQKLIIQAKDLNLQEDIIFVDKTKNPFPYYKNAIFTVLSSKNEGFPNVLIESLACETPLVAFDCLSGPSEIIVHKINGILVENQNFKALADAMELMINDENLYKVCKNNAYQSALKFDLNNIGRQWLKMMNIADN